MISRSKFKKLCRATLAKRAHRVTMSDEAMRKLHACLLRKHTSEPAIVDTAIEFISSFSGSCITASTVKATIPDLPTAIPEVINLTVEIGTPDARDIPREGAQPARRVRPGREANQARSRGDRDGGEPPLRLPATRARGSRRERAPAPADDQRTVISSANELVYPYHSLAGRRVVDERIEVLVKWGQSWEPLASVQSATVRHLVETQPFEELSL